MIGLNLGRDVFIGPEFILYQRRLFSRFVTEYALLSKNRPINMRTTYISMIHPTPGFNNAT